MPLDIQTLTRLGWGARLQQQLGFEEMEQTTPCRVMAVHRGQPVLSSSGEDEQALPIAGRLIQELDQCLVTVGDWVLVSRDTGAFVRLLDRFSLIQRQTAGSDKSRQMIAANVDTMFIVSSCNADFNLSRLERYLTIAYAAGICPVIVLTRRDVADDPRSYADMARTLGADIRVELIDARDPETMTGLRDFCTAGQTIALVGSSGVGKSTLANSLGATTQKTGGIREDDAKGRHTTTHRSLHPLSGGAVLLDNPGMRGLGLADVAAGVATAFAEIDELAQNCRFSDCGHDHEPGCAVRAAVENDALSQRRVNNYSKLMAEQERNSATTAEQRKKDKATVKFHKKVLAHKKSGKDV